MALTNVFVYGTLKPGEVNYSTCAKYVIEVRPAIVSGRLYRLPFGYPAMTLDAISPNTADMNTADMNSVHGAVLTFADSEILQLLDQFEQHDPEEFERFAPGRALASNQYKRVQFKTFTPKRSLFRLAWGYVMTIEQVERLGGVIVPDGRFVSGRK